MSRKLLAPAYCDPCPCGKIKGICVYYTGAETPNLHIMPDTNFNEVVKIIDAAQSNLSVGGITTIARAAISLTTNGTSGPATYNFVTGVLNVPIYASEATLISFDANDLPPLFTTSVTNPNVNPVLSFNLSQAAANTYFGNNLGIAGTPSHIQAGALIPVNDTNVTVSLGGNPATSLLRSVSMTLGWNGQLSLARGGTGASLSDPGNDRLMFWDDSASTVDWLDPNAFITSSNGLTGSYGSGTYTIELGGTLDHDTTITTDAYTLYLTGNTIYEYPVQSNQVHDWLNGTGIMSWKGTAKVYTDAVLNPPNLVKIGFNYTEDVYATTLENLGGPELAGYFGNRIGYFLSTNLTGHGSFGQYVDDEDSKGSGIFFHTKDSGTDGITIFSVPTSAYTPGIPVALGMGVMADYKIITAHNNLEVQLWGYPSTRDDGTPINVLGTDSNGVVQSYPVASIPGGGGGGGENPTVVTSSATSLVLTVTGSHIKTYVFTGATDTTWTLPVIGTTGQIIKIKNRGTANILLQTAGADQIYSNTQVTSILVLTGDAYELQDDATYWIING